MCFCDNCGAEFNIEPSRMIKAKHHFCDRACFRKYNIKNGWERVPQNLDIRLKLEEWAKIRTKAREYMK